MDSTDLARVPRCALHKKGGERNLRHDSRCWAAAGRLAVAVERRWAVVGCRAAPRNVAAGGRTAADCNKVPAGPGQKLPAQGYRERRTNWAPSDWWGVVLYS